MAGALLLLLFSTAGGYALTLALIRRRHPLERLAMACPAGMALSGLASFVAASWLGLGALTLALTVLFSLLPLAVLARPAARRRLVREGRAASRLARRSLRRRPRLAALLWGAMHLGLLAALFLFFRGACFVRDGAIWTLNHANLGDLPYHLGIVAGFVRGENYPPEHPEFARARLTYPFLSDYVAAVSVRAGAHAAQAFLVQNLALIASLYGLLHRFVRRVTGSDAAAHLAMPLLFFSGGWGWTRLIADLLGAPSGLKDLLWHLPRDYTNDGDAGLRWGNMLTVLLGTQRSIVLGMPLGIAVWSLWWETVGPRRRRSHAGEMLFAGLCAGTLPLGHIHSFLMLLGIGAVFALLTRRGREWALFFAAALALGLPQLAWMLTGSATQTSQFAGWNPGWDSNTKHFALWLYFWLRNTGIVFPLLIVALLAREPVPATETSGPGVLTAGPAGAADLAFDAPEAPPRPTAPILPARLVRFYLPLTLCFVVPNLVQMAPWIWDNMKVLIYAHLASAPLLASLLLWMWGRRGAWRVAVPALFVLLTLAGGLDVWRVLTGTMTQRIFSAEEIAFGEAVEKATGPRALILNAPTFAHPVYLSGRRSFMGYGGHLWSHGLDYAEREKALRQIYAGAPEADGLLSKWRIEYLAVGPKERTDVTLNEAYLARFPAVAAVGENILRRVELSR